MLGIEEGFHEPNSHMSWPLFINVSSAIYTPWNLLNCAKHVTQVGSGLGDVQSGQKKRIKPPARLLFGDKNIG